VKLVFETEIARSFLIVKSRFNLNLFLALKPPLVQMVVSRFDGCSPGNEIHLNLNTLGNQSKWVSVITHEMQDSGEWSFVDEGKFMPWPLATWRHHHRVVSLGDNSSKIIDDISFECVHSWMNVFMYPVLWFTFAIRPHRYKKFFQGE
jgi:ligand-binding SRPBCC domain-containing protein